ncbi:MAG: cob(I)yrinic acid a,c-diamide adenosyltransferase, partial [bacterium]
MKLYTGTGDQGTTSLFSGERVVKNDLRIETNGDLDELNSIIGALVASLPEEEQELIEELERIESDLFHVGAWIATSPGSPSIESLTKIKKEQIYFLENAVDRLNEKLPVLKGFILPGGHITAAWAHMARTVCRRAERQVVRLLDKSMQGIAAEQ